MFCFVLGPDPQLEECLQNQFLMRDCLEKALKYEYTVGTMDDESKIPKAGFLLFSSHLFYFPSKTIHHSFSFQAMKELIKEIVVLELEVLGLEHHLLSLYRKILSNNVQEHHLLELPPQMPEVVSLAKCLRTRIAVICCSCQNIQKCRT